jgi:hypothetical protein
LQNRIFTTAAATAGRHTEQSNLKKLPKLLKCVVSSVVDPHHVDADSEADPNSTYHPDADPDSDFSFIHPSFKKRPEPLKKG